MIQTIDALRSAARKIDGNAVEFFCSTLYSRAAHGDAVVGLGAGRMGYALRAFMMRLGHMGMNASFIGDTCVPRLNNRSTVVINSSSGKTPSIKLLAETAAAANAFIMLVTQDAKSPIAEISDAIVVVPKIHNDLPMKSFPEQFTFILFDHMIEIMCEKYNVDRIKMAERHSVLE